MKQRKQIPEADISDEDATMQALKGGIHSRVVTIYKEMETLSNGFKVYADLALGSGNARRSAIKLQEMRADIMSSSSGYNIKTIEIIDDLLSYLYD